MIEHSTSVWGMEQETNKVLLESQIWTLNVVEEYNIMNFFASVNEEVFASFSNQPTNTYIHTYDWMKERNNVSRVGSSFSKSTNI